MSDGENEVTSQPKEEGGAGENAAGSADIGSVVVLGVQGSGKTVFLSVLAKAFSEPSAFGLSMTGLLGTGTKNYVDENFRLMHDKCEWPQATNDREFHELSWNVNVARDDVGPIRLFSLTSFDCAGEMIVRALASDVAERGDSRKPRTEGAVSDGNSWSDDDERKDAHSADPKERLRQAVDRASVVCLFLNPGDFERHIAENGEGNLGGGNVSAAYRRSDDMERLLQTFLYDSNGIGSGKHIVLVVTQSERWRKHIRDCGGGKSFLGEKIPKLKGWSGFVELPPLDVIAVSAVNHTVRKDSSGRIIPREPQNGEPHDFAGLREYPYLQGDDTSSGLVEFLLAIGGPLSRLRLPSEKRIRALFSEVLFVDLCEALRVARRCQFDCVKAFRDGRPLRKRRRASVRLSSAWRAYERRAKDYVRKSESSVKKLSQRHLDEEEGRLLRWMVAGRELDASMREWLKAGCRIETREECDEFRKEVLARINDRIDETVRNHELGSCERVRAHDLFLGDDQFLIAESRRYWFWRWFLRMQENARAFFGRTAERLCERIGKGRCKAAATAFCSVRQWLETPLPDKTRAKSFLKACMWKLRRNP